VQKVRNKKFSAIFDKSNVDFLSYYFYEQRAFKHIITFVLMRMCACLKEHMRVDYVFCFLSLVARAALLAGIAEAATGKACSECKILGQLGLVCF